METLIKIKLNYLQFYLEKFINLNIMNIKIISFLIFKNSEFLLFFNWIFKFILSLKFKNYLTYFTVINWNFKIHSQINY